MVARLTFLLLGVPLAFSVLSGCGVTVRTAPTPTPWPTPIVSEKPIYAVQRGAVVNKFTLSGQVVPVTWEPLYLPVDGRLTALKVTEGMVASVQTHEEVKGMAVRRVKVGVVGCNMGCDHARAYLQLDSADLVAICDISEPWLKHCQQEWSVPSVYTRYEDMFAQPDLEAVTIALPTHLHAVATIAALNAGKHVLVEKPMAVNAAEAEGMARAARENGRVLMVSQNQRFDADSQYLKRCIDEGLLGDIYFVRAAWRRTINMLPGPTAERATDAYNRNWRNEAEKGGAARDLGSHAIDLALWLMGFPEIQDVTGCAYAPFVREFASQQSFRSDADKHSVGFVRFKNGASLQIEVSYGQHVGKAEIVTEVFGTKGGALRVMRQPLQLFGSVAGGYTITVPQLPAESDTSPQKAFIASILSGQAPAVTAEEGITVMHVIDQILSR